LFPDYFESLCIRFGLLGTLLSFLLAAVSQLAEPAAATQVARPGSLGARVEQLAQEPIEPGAVAPVPREEVPSTPKTGKTSRLSSQVFLLLCASLVSTFVGTFVAYIMIPPMNLLNDGAVGMLQRGRTDEANTAEEFFRQLDRTSQRLAEFETTTAALSSAADGVVRFQIATNEAAESFAQAVSLMQDLKHQYKDLTRQTNELVRRLASFEHQSSRMTEGIRTFYENLQKPLDRMYQAALRIEHSAEAENNAAQAVAHLTRTVQGPLSVIHAAGTYRWKTMSDIRDSLKLLADEEGSQRDAFIEVAGAFTHIGGILSELMQGLDAFLVEQMQARGDREDVEKQLKAMRHQLAVIEEQLNWDYGKGLPSEAELEQRPRRQPSISERLARRGREPRSGGRWWGRFSQWLRRNGAKTGTSSKDEPDADSSAEVPTEEIL